MQYNTDRHTDGHGQTDNIMQYNVIQYNTRVEQYFSCWGSYYRWLFFQPPQLSNGKDVGWRGESGN